MRRLLVLVLALGMIAAACGDDDAASTTTSAAASTTTAATGEVYPADMVDAYMEGCIPEGGEELCRCTIEEYQTRLTFEEFLDYSTNTPNLGSDPLSLEIIEVCLRTTDTTGTTTAGGEPTPFATMEDVIDATLLDLDAFWDAEMPEVWGIDYTTPIVNGPYYVSRGDVPTCGAPMEPAGYQGNAFYCGFEDTVQWDAEGLMAPLYEQFGDFTVALVLAHEWGHAIQERFGFDDSASPTIVSELQADCLAGTWTGYVAAGESDILVLEPGDLEEAMSGFLLIGDQLGTVPQGEGAHGLSFDRLNAFFDGYDQGTSRCAEYETLPRDDIVVSSQIGLDLLAQGEDVNLPYEDTATLLIEALEAFWAIVYPDVFGGEWVPVSGIFPYDPDGTVPTCGGFSPEVTEFNAFYCAAEDFVAWDDLNLFPALYSEIGDMAIGLVLSNEWGRAVQARAGLPTEGVGAQLQVDCLSGVWTAALTHNDPRIPIILTAGDLEEGISGLLALSATPGIEGAASAFQRFAAFKAGFLEGITACGVA
ncbi:MAG TPA: zinc metallopeptidase [Actinobacteria bacterium]|nr:zinc metallopeptidase [Actinomycetota bacterium]